ncbi:MAG: rod shape-determining protein MreC [Candidatus Brennerbacteria bacterium]
MRSLKTVIGAIAALVLGVLIIVMQGNMFEGVGDVRAFFASFTDRTFSYGELSRLRTEVEALRAERAVLIEAGIPPFSADLRKAPVYSRYPYGAEGLLTIALGAHDGIKEGFPVFATPGTLLGRVTRVEQTRSEVMTIFNPAWRSSVRFGTSDVKALLEGGESPRLTLIPRGKELAEHTRVVSVDPTFPFGLFIGTSGAVQEETAEPWRTAAFEAPYRESDLEEVLVLVNFP